MEDVDVIGQLGRLASGLGDVPPSVASAFGRLAADGVVARRQRRQGVTLVYAGDDALAAALLFRDIFHGILLHTAACPLLHFMYDLKDFRFGWLPAEVVCGQGGAGSAFLGDAMPAEAEGFVPTFVTGSRRHGFAGKAVLID